MRRVATARVRGPIGDVVRDPQCLYHLEINLSMLRSADKQNGTLFGRLNLIQVVPLITGWLPEVDAACRTVPSVALTTLGFPAIRSSQ